MSYFWRNSTRLYQFDLPYDAGKVIDASVFPSTDDTEEGAWVVLTEKAGVWAIPEKAVLFGGVEPPERSLSRKGSSNEKSPAEENKNLLNAAGVSPGKAGLDARDVGGKQRSGFTGVAGKNAQDEEAEALLNRLFHDFLLSGQVDGSLEKLKNVRAFERDGETNVFARASKSIVDSLAKHWTTTRGAEIVSLAVVSNQLIEKQQKHEKFLQFLALSKCHEELCLEQSKCIPPTCRLRCFSCKFGFVVFQYSFLTQFRPGSRPRTGSCLSFLSGFSEIGNIYTTPTICLFS